MTVLTSCRSNCGACCIAPSISSAIPGMPNGKLAGQQCVNLDVLTWQCTIWGTADYPAVCANFKPCQQVCGQSRDDALAILTLLQRATN